MNPLRTQWITVAEDFRALREQWNELLQSSACNTLFLTWEWQYTWWEHLAEGRSLFILTVRDGERLIALAPLALRPANYSRMVPFRVLELIGTGSVGSDYLSIIVRSGDEGRALTEITKCLIARNVVVEMSNTDRSNSIMTTTALRMQSRGCRAARHTQNFSPWIDLTQYTWDSYLHREGSSNGARYNKKLRKLQRTFAVSLDLTREEGTRTADLQTLIGLHLKRWDGRGGSNAFGTPGLRSFHEAFSRLALQQRWLRLFVLRLDNVPAAAVYGFFYFGVFYYYQAGFDPQFSQYSVGQLGVGLTLEHAFAEGAREYDLLRGEEEYKYAWADNERELVCLSVYPSSVKGSLCAGMMTLRQGVKSLILETL